MTAVALSTGPRRGELLGLRWQDVHLLERRLHVRQAFVRNEITTLHASRLSVAGQKPDEGDGEGRFLLPPAFGNDA